MSNSQRLISVLRATCTDSRAKKMADFYQSEPQIREAMSQGWKLINIWNLLKEQGKFSGGYDSFRRYTKKLFSHKSSQNFRSIQKNESQLTAQLTKKALGENPDSKRSQKNLALFLGRKEEIREALEAGYCLKTIWKTLIEMGVFDASYNSFTCYVRRHLIHGDDLHSPQEKTQKNKNHSNTPVEKSIERKDAESSSGGFDHFNYHPAEIDKESLI